MKCIGWVDVVFGRNVVVFVGVMLAATFTVFMNDIVSAVDCNSEWVYFFAENFGSEENGICFVLLFLVVCLVFGAARFFYMSAALLKGVDLAVERRELFKNFLVSLATVFVFFCVLVRYGIDPNIHNELLTGKVLTFLILMAWYFWAQSLFVVFSKLLLVMIGRE